MADFEAKNISIVYQLDISVFGSFMTDFEARYICIVYLEIIGV